MHGGDLLHYNGCPPSAPSTVHGAHPFSPVIGDLIGTRRRLAHYLTSGPSVVGRRLVSDFHNRLECVL